MTNTLSPAALEALKACLSTRGKSKGLLLRTAPSPFSYPEANAAWNAAMLSVNPFKASLFSLMMNTRKPELQAIANEITAFFDAHPELRFADRDSAALERLGVW